jgi:hypothetical protein
VRGILQERELAGVASRVRLQLFDSRAAHFIQGGCTALATAIVLAREIYQDLASSRRCMLAPTLRALGERLARLLSLPVPWLERHFDGATKLDILVEFMLLTMRPISRSRRFAFALALVLSLIFHRGEQRSL